MRAIIFTIPLLLLGGCIDTAYQTPYIISHTPEETTDTHSQEELR